MKCTTIYREGTHRWLAFGQDTARPENVGDTLQYAVCAGNSVMLIDPGGMEVFPAMIAALTRDLAVEDVRHILLSHQDPHVASALPLWRRVCRADLQILAPALWTPFIAHLDREAPLTAIPDEGMDFTLGSQARLRVLPAHHLHSPGNVNVYDPAAKVLFSGTVGSALQPGRGNDMFVDNFADHVRPLESFHKRWIGSAVARDAWVAMASKLDIGVLAPQHGLMLRGDQVKRFIDWFAGLDIAGGLRR